MDFFPSCSEAIDPSGMSPAAVLKKKKINVFQRLDMIVCKISSL